MISITKKYFSSLSGNQFGSTFTVICAVIANFLFASGHDIQRCVQITALCVTMVIYFNNLARGAIHGLQKPIAVLLLLFLTLGLASATIALSPRHAIYEWSSLSLLLLMVIAIASELSRDIERLTIFLDLIGVTCILYSLRVLLMYAAALASGFQPDWSALSVGFSNLRHLNHTQTALMPLIILLILKSPKGIMWRKTWFILASFWWALLFVTEARASILSLTVACAMAMVLRRSHSREFLMTAMLTALSGAVLYVVLFMWLPVWVGLMPIGTPMSVLERTAVNPSSNRNILWAFALELIAAHPWLGIGPQHFAHAAASLNTGAHPHNWILQIAAEWGIPALLCLVGAVFLGGRALLRSGKHVAHKDLLNQQILVTLQIACIAIFVDGLFSGVIVMPQSQLAIAVVLSIAYAWVRMQATQGEAGTKPTVTQRAVMAAIGAIALGGLIWSVAPDFMGHARGDPLTPVEAAASPVMHWPRMWEAGYF